MTGRPVEVQCRRFSDILKEYGVPYYLKIDIEGSEWRLLEDPRFAGLRFLATILEWHPAGAPTGDPRTAAHDALQNAGFTTRDVEGGPPDPRFDPTFAIPETGGVQNMTGSFFVLTSAGEVLPTPAILPSNLTIFVQSDVGTIRTTYVPAARSSNRLPVMAWMA